MTARVLIVDDEPDVRLAARLHLARAGWDVAEASSGEEALAAAADVPFAAVVLDQRMPGLSGLATAQALLDAGYTGALVLFSGYLTPDLERQAGELGVRTLDKAAVRELRSTIEGLLGREPG